MAQYDRGMAPAPDSAVLEQPTVQPDAPNTTSGRQELLLVDDLLVEEISIDGMCGVY